MDPRMFFSDVRNIETILKETDTITLVHPSKGKTIRLVGVVHIATPEYYQRVLSSLQKMDVVLYECIEDESKERKIPVDNPYQDLAQKMNDYLEEQVATSQHYGIDYLHLPANWNKADITLKEARSFLPHKPEHQDGKKEGEREEERIIDNMIGEFIAYINALKAVTKRRDEKLLSVLEEFEARGDVASIGVLYGNDHFKALEQSLVEKGYTRVNHETHLLIPKQYHERLIEMMMEERNER